MAIVVDAKGRSTVSGRLSGGVRRTDMVDRVTSERRSEIMRSVGQKDTGAEMKVHQALHLLGYRYRLHRRELPGKPDVVFPSRRKTVFVHGCFWHGHDCRFGRLPKSNFDY